MRGRVICLLLLCLTSLATRAADIRILEDKGRSLSAEQVYNIYTRGNVPFLKDNKYNSGFTSSVYWLIIETPKNSANSTLLIGNPHINRLDFYGILNGKPELTYITGDHYPFSQRMIPDRLFAFPLSSANGLSRYLLRVDKHGESLQLHAEVLSGDDFHFRKTTENSVNSFFWGIFILTIIFSLFLFVSFKDLLYLYYSLYILTAFLWIITDLGYGYQVLWPDLPYLASRARLFLNMCFTVAMIQFMQAFIGQAKGSRWFKPLQVIKILNIVFAVLVIVLPYPTGNATKLLYGFLTLHLTLNILGLIPFVLSITEKIRENNRQAWFYLISVVAVLFCISAELFEQAGVTGFSTSYFQDYGVQTGVAIEAIILNFGLVSRFNQYKNEREQLLIHVNQKQNELTERIIETQEAERKKIADQLHDEVGSLLSLVSLQISSVIEQDEANRQAVLKLKKADEVLHTVTDTVRNMSHRLTPLVIERYGFRNAIIDLQSNINLAGVIKIECVIIGFDDKDKYNIHLLNDLYRIVQELVNNIIKHAEATHALVQIIGYDEMISVIIEDNGKGMTNGRVKAAGIGLAGIHSKIDYFGGQIELSQKRDGGTLVNIEIPV